MCDRGRLEMTLPHKQYIDAQIRYSTAVQYNLVSQFRVICIKDSNATMLQMIQMNNLGHW